MRECSISYNLSFPGSVFILNSDSNVYSVTVGTVVRRQCVQEGILVESLQPARVSWE